MAPKNSKEMLEDSNPNLEHKSTFNSQTMADSPYLLSYPSEPPDIRNWFSSYEYESSALDFDDSDCDGIGCKNLADQKKANAERFRNPESPDASSPARKPFDGFVTCQRRPVEDLEQKHWLVNEDTFSPEICPQNFLSRNGKDDRMQGQSLHKCNYTAMGADENSSANRKTSQDKSNDKCFGIDNHIVSKTGVSLSKDGLNFLKGLLAGGDHEYEQVEGHDVQADGNLILTNQSSLQKSLPRSNVEEAMPNDGFISTRNNKNTAADGGTSPCRSILKHPLATKSSTLCEVNLSEDDEKLRTSHVGRSRQKECKENAVLVLHRNGKPSVVGRTALSDQTNFDTEMMPEITGKWKCPQKGKPYIGPPLKQLRLERWVHPAV